MKLLLIITIFFSTLFGWVGKITALKGDAQIIREKKSIPAKVGMQLDEKDNIKTSTNTKMQIIFKDDTVITIGKNSELKISDYVFDDKRSEARFKLGHGIMKTLTGKIGKIAPKRFKVITKNASIGIRGTYFVVESDKFGIKLGMISGITVFTNLDTMKTYEVTAGEQLIFNIKTPQKVIIKKDFVDPYAKEALSTKKSKADVKKEIIPKKTTQKPKKVEAQLPNPSKEVEKVVQDVEDTQNSASQDVTTSETPKSAGTFTKFLEGLKSVF